jgi:hypothetical protein
VTWIANNATTASLSIEDCTINNFSTNGVNVALGGSNVLAELYMRNVVARNNTVNGTTAGVQLNAGGGLIRAVLQNVSLDNNSIGLHVNDRARVVMSDSTASGNSGVGVRVLASAGAEVDLTRVTIAGNGKGVVSASNSSSIVRLEGAVITGNGIGVDNGFGAQVLSPGASPGGPGINFISGNTTDINGSLGSLPTR